MILLTAPMVKKLDQLIAGGGGGGGSTDLTPVLDAIAAIETGSGGSVDLTPVLNAVAAVDSKAVALQTSVAAIPTTGGGSTDLTPVLDAIAALPAPGSAGSPIKSIQRLNISAPVSPGATVTFPIATINPAKAFVNSISFAAFIVSTLNMEVEANQLKIVSTSASTSYTPILKLEIIEYV